MCGILFGDISSVRKVGKSAIHCTVLHVHCTYVQTKYTAEQILRRFLYAYFFPSLYEGDIFIILNAVAHAGKSPPTAPSQDSNRGPCGSRPVH